MIKRGSGINSRSVAKGRGVRHVSTVGNRPVTKPKRKRKAVSARDDKLIYYRRCIEAGFTSAIARKLLQERFKIDARLAKKVSRRYQELKAQNSL